MNLQQLCAVAEAAGISDLSGGVYSDYILIGKVTSTYQMPVESKWADEWRQRLTSLETPEWNRMRLPDITKEFTFGDCTDWSFSIKAKTLTVRCFDGNSFDGHRTKLRASWDFTLTDSHRLLIDKILIPDLTRTMMLQAASAEIRYQEALHEARVKDRYDHYFTVAGVPNDIKE